MINLLWLLMLLGGLVAAGLGGSGETITQISIEGAQAAANLALELIGVMALWLGIMKIAEESGLIFLLARALRPLMGFLFPEIPPEHPALGAIIMNLSANILGLGNAATPFGLKAMMEELQSLNLHPEEATPAMCTFLALNISCLTLVPATIMGIRAAAGSSQPGGIIGPTIMATGLSMVTAILADKLFRRWGGRGRWVS